MLLHPDHLYRLVLTYVIGLLHTWLSFLAFKNDVGFWKSRETLAGTRSTS
jgi:hypothetical protein